MPILNYTTTIAVDKTLGEIQGMLAKGGARQISIDYDDAGVPSGVSFTIKSASSAEYYVLPAKVDAVYRVLERQYNEGKVRRGMVTHEQAARVGWRIIRDWLEAQLAIIQAQMVTLDQVMFPYQLAEGEKTVYQLYREHQAALPKPQS